MTFSNFIKRPVLSTVISIFFVLLGIIGLIALPVEQYPDIAPPTIQVSTSYAGADAQTVLNSVIVPLEESINGVENMTYMTSQATNEGKAQITIYFKQGTDPDMASVNVQNRVTQAQALLPSEVTQVGVTTSKRQSSNVIIFSLTSDNGRYDEKFLTNYSDINIVPALKRVKGVGNVQIFGALTYSMRIWLQPDKMKQYNLMPQDIVAALAEQNIEAAPGKFGEQSNMAYEYTMRYKGRLKNPQEYNNIIISSNTDGNTLYLRDVAKIELGGLSYAVSMESDGKPAVIGAVQQVSGSNATEVANGVKKEFENQAKNFPPGMKMNVVVDVTDFLFASIEEVFFTLFLTLALVFLVVYIFLQDLRSTLIPLIAVPVSLIGTFLFLWMFGFSINLLTLSALLLAIAIVVDDAIVVVEAVHAKLDIGYKSSLTASIDAMNELSSAIISITLVMAAVFVPVSFLSGTSGTFYREFGVTMAISIVISAINALTLSPALCALLLKPHNKKENKANSTFINRFNTSFNTAFDKITNKYKKGVERIIKKPIITAIAVVFGILVLIITMSTTSTGLVPNEDTGNIMISISTPPGTSKSVTRQIVNDVDKMLANNPAIETRQNLVGFSLIGGQGSNQAAFFIKLKSFDKRASKNIFLRIAECFKQGSLIPLFLNPMESNMVLGMIYKQVASIKGAQILAFGPPMIPGFSMVNGITMTMQDKTGGNINKFLSVTRSFLEELQKRPEVSKAMTTYDTQYPQYMVDVDVTKTKQAGISPKTVLSTLQGYYGGMYASNFNTYGKLYRVMIQGTAESRLTKESLQNIYVRTPKGMAPIKSFITLQRIYGPQVMNRFNLFTSIDVNITPQEGYSSGDVLKAIDEVSKAHLPAGYGYEYSGLTRSESEQSNTTVIIFALCIVFVYLILSALYESYLLPLAVVLSIPFGLAGAFLFTLLFGHNNDIYMQISLIMLIGLLAKNAILIVEFALDRRRTGMDIRHAAILGAKARLRPVLMTALAMIVGLIPLMFASGVGRNGNQTLGAAAVGGMLIGTLCQVFFVPTLFTIFQHIQERFSPIHFNNEKNKDNLEKPD